jgi:hypothetical protein
MLPPIVESCPTSFVICGTRNRQSQYEDDGKSNACQLDYDEDVVNHDIEIARAQFTVDAPNASPASTASHNHEEDNNRG